MNAIILAAGMGTRLRPLTNDIPKCLVKINGMPMVERQIQFLHEIGIEDITLVSGYKAEKLDFLKEKYGVDIVFNEKYDICNNIYSMYKVLDRFGDTWVIEGDIYMQSNCFTKNIGESTYFAKWHDHYIKEWGLVTNSEGYLESINVGDGQGMIMSGISFWNVNDAKNIIDEIMHLIKKEDYEDLFWDNSVINVLNKVNIRVQRFDDLFEMDTLEDILQFNNI